MGSLGLCALKFFSFVHPLNLCLPTGGSEAIIKHPAKKLFMFLGIDTDVTVLIIHVFVPEMLNIQLRCEEQLFLKKG